MEWPLLSPLWLESMVRYCGIGPQRLADGHGALHRGIGEIRVRDPDSGGLRGGRRDARIQKTRPPPAAPSWEIKPFTTDIGTWLILTRPVCRCTPSVAL